jgi:site-specific DNA-methyltransferase (adenine-specific)
MSDVRLMLGDCLDVMGEIADGSIEGILADLPYGTTACKWDQVIPFEPLWAHYRRVLRPRGAVVLTASQPFTSMLVMSNREWFRYDLIWDKVCTSGFLNAKHSPMRSHESILVFGDSGGTYNPQMVERTSIELKRLNHTSTKVPNVHAKVYRDGLLRWPQNRYDHKLKYPASVLCLTSREGKDVRGLHPTQKPVPLFEYLIRTYSNPGDVVLDNTMGSGTTGVACLNTDRSFIGIERDPTYFATAEARIDDVRAATPLFPVA